MDVTAAQKLQSNGISVDESALRELAQRYQIQKISVFGSSLHGQIAPNSDVDLLVSFHTDALVSLFDLMDLEAELTELFGRKVDVVEPQSLTNPVRRRSILSSAEPLYAA